MPSFRCRMCVHRIVQQLAVVADDQRGVRVFLQPRFEPERAFQVEIVGRLVQQQQVGLGEQRRRQRHAHPPAAGELRHRPRRGRRWRSPGPPGFPPRAPARGRRRSRSAARRCRPCCSGSAVSSSASRRRALVVGGQHGVEQRDRRRRMLLIHRADPRGFGQPISPPPATSSPRISLNSVDLPTPLRPTRPTLAPYGNGDGRLVEEPAAPGVENEIFDPKHGAGRLN